MATLTDIPDASGTAYGNPARYDVYQNSLRNYQNSEMAKYASVAPMVMTGWGENADITGGQTVWNPPEGFDPYMAWRGMLSPQQQAEYDGVVESHFAKGTATGKGAFIAALAAMTGGAALGAAGAEVGGVAAMGDVGMGAGGVGGYGAGGVIGAGAGDAGAGMGWMGGADAAGAGTMGDALAGGGMAGDAGMASWMDGASAWGGGGGGNAGTSQSWLQGLMKNFGGGGSGGGGFGSFMPSTAKDWMSVGSGIYGMYRGNQQDKLAQQALAGSAPWASGGGMANAGAALTNVINGDFTNDPGFKQAQLAAARASSQQPGGAASSAAAMAALKYQNDRIAALSGPAGVGFNPAAGYQTALGGYGQGNQLASSSLGSIGYGMSGGSMPPWLQAYLIQHGMGG